MKTNSSTVAGVAADGAAGAILAGLGLPVETTAGELQAILEANGGALAPIKPSVYGALLTHLLLQNPTATDDGVVEYIADKFPMIPRTAPQAELHGDYLARLGLPEGTTASEFNTIIAANEGMALPFKGRVHEALLRHLMVSQGLPGDEAGRVMAERFSMIPAPVPGTRANMAGGSLREQLLRIHNLPADATDDDIAAATAAAADYQVQDRIRRATQEADELLIAEKVSKGISREQAMGVIKRQREHDERVKAERAERLPALLEVIGNHGRDRNAARRAVRDVHAFIDGSEFEAAWQVYKKQGKA